MKSLKLFALSTLIVPAFVLSGCGEGSPDIGNTPQNACAEESRADTYVEGLEKASDAGMFKVKLVRVEINAQATQPDRGDNTWTLELTDANGTPMDPSVFTLRPWMPDHGHGTTPLINPIRASMPEGRFEVGPFDLFMSGFWEFTVNVENDGQSDQAKLGFCLEG